VKFTHHAKNNLRLYGVRVQEVESVVRNPIGKDFERRGNPRYRAMVAGRPYRVVVALDEPDLIITHFPEERG
jgi:Domain of unknown function (DUF4258)